MMKFGRYDYASYYAFTAYACSSLIVPLLLVQIGNSLNFPLADGGMGVGGGLQISRSLAMLVLLLLCGAISYKFGKRLTLGISLLVMGVGTVFCACSNNLAMLTLGILIAGMGEGICEGVATPFVNDMHLDAPGGYVNIAHSFWSVGTVFVVLVVCFLNSLGLNWRWLVGVCGAIALSSALPFLWKEAPGAGYPERNEAQAGGVWKKSCTIVKSCRFWLYCFCMLIGAGAEFGLTFWSAAFIQLHFGAGVWAGALGTASIGLGMFVGRFCYGRFVPQEKLWHLLMTCAFGGLPFSIGLLLITPESFGGNSVVILAVVYLLLFVCGLGVAPFWPSLQVYGVLRLPQLDSTMLYVYFSSIGIPGCGLFTWLMGVIGDHLGARYTILLVPISMFIYGSSLLLDRLKRQKRQ